MPLSKIQGIEGQVTPNLGRRNLIINGAMQVAQRGTSSTDNTYGSVDRYQLSRNQTDELVVTQSQDSDTPAGQGFGYSFKVNITTAESALAADENLNFHQRIEGQNLQRLEKGTSNAKSTTLSFWVKSNTTGTYVLELYDSDNNRHAAKTYTIDSANTWEKKTITFAGDTTGALNNDNGRSMDVRWWLAAGSNFSSGTLPTGWASLTAANRAAGQVNLMASTNNWYITGIQFEVSDTATDFEHRSFAEELALCQRYYEEINVTAYFVTGNSYSTSQFNAAPMFFKTKKRSTPNITFPTIGTTSGTIGPTDATANYVSSMGSVLRAYASPDWFQIYNNAGDGYSGFTDDGVCQIYSYGTTTITANSEL